MHPAPEDLEVQLGHRKFVLLVLERRLVAVVLIMELLVALVLSHRTDPGEYEEEEAEERPPEADTEPPDHSLYVVLELVHDRCR